MTITVHDASHNKVTSAVVTGTWSGAATGSATCTTSTKGTCSVSKTGLLLTAPNATFTVTGVSKSGYTYGGMNHDPESDSNGTTITIVK